MRAKKLIEICRLWNCISWTYFDNNLHKNQEEKNKLIKQTLANECKYNFI